MPLSSLNSSLPFISLEELMVIDMLKAVGPLLVEIIHIKLFEMIKKVG